MGISEHLEASGQWLFRWRGYLPVLVLVLAVASELAGSGARAPTTSRIPWEIACLMVSAFGLGIRVIAVGHTPADTSGRNAREQRAATLNTTGLYSVVRHPLYLGNFFLMLGVVLFARSSWLTACYLMAFWLYYERIMAAEEAFLRRRFGDAFERWSGQVPAFLPRLRGWLPAALPFSLKNVLRREYNGFFAVFVSMFVLDLARNEAERRRLVADPRWLAMLGAAMVIWLVLRSLKRYTQALRVKGR